MQISDEDLLELEQEMDNSPKNSEDPLDSSELSELLNKAVLETKKRVSKKEHHREISNTETENSGIIKEAAYKNMKPKTAYLLGSPDNSDEEEEEEQEVEPLIKNVESKYLL